MTEGTPSDAKTEVALQESVMNRWLVVFGGILIQLCLGAIYAWSAFTTALKDPNGAFKFSATETQVIFSVGLAAFAACTIIGGRWQVKAGPRMVAMIGGIILGIGYLLGGFAGTSFYGILGGIGIIGGAGIGLAYVVPIAVGVKWFPDKKGLITGLAVAGFGFGALIWILLAGKTSFWPGLVPQFGVSKTFMIYGGAFFIFTLLGAIWMKNPPEGWKPAGWNPPGHASNPAKTAQTEFPPGEMLGTPQFFMLWSMFACGALAGLMVIGIIKLFGTEALQYEGRMTAEQAKTTSAFAMAVFFALANGIGRIAWGAISDKIGRKASLVLMLAIQGVTMLTFFYMARSTYSFYLVATLVGFNFGGNFALFPAMTADFFGNKNVGRNYGWVFTAYGIGGIVGPILAGVFRDMGTKGEGVDAWLPAFIIAGVVCLLAAGVGLLLKHPKHTQPA